MKWPQNLSTIPVTLILTQTSASIERVIPPSLTPFQLRQRSLRELTDLTPVLLEIGPPACSKEISIATPLCYLQRKQCRHMYECFDLHTMRDKTQVARLYPSDHITMGMKSNVNTWKGLTCRCANSLRRARFGHTKSYPADRLLQHLDQKANFIRLKLQYLKMCKRTSVLSANDKH